MPDLLILLHYIFFYKYETRVEMLDCDKHSDSLYLKTIIEEKFFINLPTGFKVP